MDLTDHLTDEQIKPYSELSEDEQKHLLVCKECREKMPLPTVEEFWDALLKDGEG